MDHKRRESEQDNEMKMKIPKLNSLILHQIASIIGSDENSSN